MKILLVRNLLILFLSTICIIDILITKHRHTLSFGLSFVSLQKFGSCFPKFFVNLNLRCFNLNLREFFNAFYLKPCALINTINMFRCFFCTMPTR